MIGGITKAHFWFLKVLDMKFLEKHFYTFSLFGDEVVWILIQELADLWDVDLLEHRFQIPCFFFSISTALQHTSYESSRIAFDLVQARRDLRREEWEGKYNGHLRSLVPPHYRLYLHLSSDMFIWMVLKQSWSVSGISTIKKTGHSLTLVWSKSLLYCVLFCTMVLQIQTRRAWVSSIHCALGPLGLLIFRQASRGQSKTSKTTT